MIVLVARAGAFALCLLLIKPARVQAAPSPRMLLETTDLSSLAISPDGQRVAFRQEQASVERNTYDTIWWVQDLQAHTVPRRVADGGVPLRFDYGGAISEPPIWSPDGAWIYYRALLGGEVQIWRAASDGARAQQLTHDPSDIRAFALSRDGQRLIYSVGAARADILRAEQDEDDHGVRIDQNTPVGQGLVRSGLINGRLATQRLSSAWMDRRGLLDDQPTRQRVVDLANLTPRDATPEDEDAFPRPVASLAATPGLDPTLDVRVRSPDRRAIAFLQTDGTHQSLRVTADETATQSLTCEAAPCRRAAISAIAWRPGHNEIVFTVTDRDQARAQSLYLWDLTQNAVRRLVQTNGLIGGGRGAGPDESCAISATVAACVTAEADIPPRLESVDLTTGARQVLYAPNTALEAAVGPRTQVLHWDDGEGRRFTGQFFPAAGLSPGARAPLFITYYRCNGFLRGGLGDEWPLASLAGAGIAALCINEPAIDPAHPDQSARYATALSGLKSVIALLRDRGLVDPARVGLGGLSFGSEVVLWAAMNSDLAAAGSVSSAAVTPTYYRLHALQGPTFHATLKTIWGLDSPEDTPDRWRRISPAFNTGRIKCPLLMQMSEQEYLSALDYFEPLAARYKAELYVFPNEPHQKFQPRHKLAVYERNLDWFRYWLQDYKDLDPLKASQYLRWDAMRGSAVGLKPQGNSAAAPPSTLHR